MTSFVLVHGSGQNAGSWSRVAALLVARGHAVVAPDLPKRAPGWGLEQYAAKVAESVTRPDTVVVAHSLCGVLLPLVAEVRGCGLLVFLAAVIPESGKSVRDQFTEDPSMFSPQWIHAGPRWFEKSNVESLAKEFLFHDCDDQTLPFGLATLEMLETRELSIQPSPLTNWSGVPAASIVATGDRTLSPDWGRRATRRVLGTEAIEIQAGHCPHVSRPTEIAAVLERLVAERAG